MSNLNYFAIWEQETLHFIQLKFFILGHRFLISKIRKVKKKILQLVSEGVQTNGGIAGLTTQVVSENKFENKT